MQTGPVLHQVHLMLDTVDQEADALGIDPRRVAVWSGSAGVPFGVVAALDHPSVRCRVAFYGPMDLRTDDSRTAPGVSADALAEHSPITHLERLGGNIQPLFIAKAGLDRPGINDSIDAFVARAAPCGSPCNPLYREGLLEVLLIRISTLRGRRPPFADHCSPKFAGRLAGFEGFAGRGGGGDGRLLVMWTSRDATE